MAANKRDEQQLGLQSSMKAVTKLEEKGEPKIGVEEFLSLADRFGISHEGQTKIREIMKTESLSQGEGPFLANYYSGLKETKVQAFERTARKIFGSKYAIGVSSGTGALHAAFVAAGVGPGKEVICPAIGFIATAAAVVQSNGIPVFCEVDSSLAMDPAKIESCITERTVAIAPTHVMGCVCDMAAIMKVTKKHNLIIVEDCAQSAGGRFREKYVGTIGHMGVFSISAYKTIGGGEGGLLLTDDRKLWERASQLVETGGLWRPVRFAKSRFDGELFSGSNYRFSELEAAVDLVQLGKLEATATRFRSVRRIILQQLKTYREIEPQKLNDPEGEVGYLLRFFPESFELGKSIVQDLKQRGIEAETRGDHGCPDWHQYSYMYPIVLKRGSTDANCPYECPIYRQNGGNVQYGRGSCPVADDLFDRMVTIKLNQWYSPEDCGQIARIMNEVFVTFCTEDPGEKPWL